MAGALFRELVLSEAGEGVAPAKVRWAGEVFSVHSMPEGDCQSTIHYTRFNSFLRFGTTDGKREGKRTDATRRVGRTRNLVMGMEHGNAP
jgi:hypothetical protein